VVAQELQAHGFELYYFNSKKQGELDFIIEKGGRTLPIEVKQEVLGEVVYDVDLEGIDEG